MLTEKLHQLKNYSDVRIIYQSKFSRFKIMQQTFIGTSEIIFLLKVTNVRVNFRTVYWCSSEKKIEKSRPGIRKCIFVVDFLIF